MKAIVVGATGATGKELVKQLLADDDFSEIIIFVRRETGIEHQKLTTHIINFDMPEQWENQVQGDVLFSCLGTTLKMAGSQQAQWRIDYEYQLQFAKIAYGNGIKTYVLVSSKGANPNSKLFYTRMKGQLEKEIKKLDFNRLLIMNPPILIRENSDRNSEKIGVCILKFLNKIGLLHSQKPMPTWVLAQSMINNSKKTEQGIFHFSAEKIRESVVS